MYSSMFSAFSLFHFHSFPSFLCENRGSWMIVCWLTPSSTTSKNVRWLDAFATDFQCQPVNPQVLQIPTHLIHTLVLKCGSCHCQMPVFDVFCILLLLEFIEGLLRQMGEDPETFGKNRGSGECNWSTLSKSNRFSSFQTSGSPVEENGTIDVSGPSLSTMLQLHFKLYKPQRLIEQHKLRFRGFLLERVGRADSWVSRACWKNN